MVKKAEKPASRQDKSPASLFDNQLAQSVKESAQQIWLAGMGAFAKAQQGRAKVFEALIKDGLGLQRKTQNAAEEKIGEVTGRMSAMAGDVTAKAGQHWDKFETIFEQRTAKAMNKLGVPTAKDVDALIKRVDELATAVARLSKSTPARVSAKSTAKAPAKAATRSSAKAAARPAAQRAAARKKAR